MPDPKKVSSYVLNTIERYLEDLKHDDAPFAGTQRALFSMLERYLAIPTKEDLALFVKVAEDYRLLCDRH